jgi:hypothetical protein
MRYPPLPVCAYDLDQRFSTIRFLRKNLPGCESLIVTTINYLKIHKNKTSDPCFVKLSPSKGATTSFCIRSIPFPATDPEKLDGNRFDPWLTTINLKFEEKINFEICVEVCWKVLNLDRIFRKRSLIWTKCSLQIVKISRPQMFSV